MESFSYFTVACFKIQTKSAQPYIHALKNLTFQFNQLRNGVFGNPITLFGFRH